jgi:hypothetical protein
MKTPVRKLSELESELAIACDAEDADERFHCINIGKLLREVNEQLGHGEWLPWLERNWRKSVSTAENYMNAARLADKFPSLGNLKLRRDAIYELGGMLDNPDQGLFDAVLKEAETTWVNAKRVGEIEEEIYYLRHDAKLRARHDAKLRAILEAAKHGVGASEYDETEELRKAREAREAHERYEEELAAARAAIAAKAAAAAILDGPTTEPPPAPATPRATALSPFDQCINELEPLSTKPFAKTVHAPGRIRRIAEFLHDYANFAENQDRKAS